MASDAEHFLMCLLAMCKYSMERRLFLSSAHFMTGLFVSWVLSLITSSQILDTSLYLSFANSFSHAVGCLLVLLTVSFAVQKLFILMKSQEFIFAFVSLAFIGVSCKKVLWPSSCNFLQHPKGCWLCSPLGFWWILVSHIDLSSILNVSLCVVEEKGPVSFFCTSCPIFTAPFIEETVRFQVDSLSCFVEH